MEVVCHSRICRAEPGLMQQGERGKKVKKTPVFCRKGSWDIAGGGRGTEVVCC